jgi:hypothetical protein
MSCEQHLKVFEGLMMREKVNISALKFILVLLFTKRFLNKKYVFRIVKRGLNAYGTYYIPYLFDLNEAYSRK